MKKNAVLNKYFIIIPSSIKKKINEKKIDV